MDRYKLDYIGIIVHDRDKRRLPKARRRYLLLHLFLRILRGMLFHVYYHMKHDVAAYVSYARAESMR
jgi:hypothetical protein